MSDALQGILLGGNFIIDHVKIIDAWPAQDQLASILEQSMGNGGSPYNVLSDLVKLGAPFRLGAVGRVGEDEDGRTIRADLESKHVDVSQLQATPGVATSYTDVMTVRDTGRRTFFHQRGANAVLGPGDFNFSGSYRLFHLGYLLLLDTLDELSGDRTAASHVLEAARQAGLKTCVDVVSESSDRFTAIVKPSLPFTDYLIINEYEAGKIIGEDLSADGDPSPESLLEAARELARLGVRDTVVIHCPSVAVAVPREGEDLIQPSLDVPADFIKGANGAGDAFLAGMLYGLHEEWPLPRCLKLAVASAASCLSHPTTSGGLCSVEEAFALAERLGYRPL